ncbi:MAG: metallophosphoesterase [Flavobacteriales bacterium]|nr:metallophosphoesterase [Flavobacteriales bacterium]
MSPQAVRNFAIFSVLLVLIDLYAYKGVNVAMENHSIVLRRIVRFLYWTISVSILGMIAWTILGMQGSQARRDHSHVFSLVAIFLLFFLPKLILVVFHGLDDLLHAGRWVWSKLLPGPSDGSGEMLNRANFLSQLGLVLATVPFAGVLYGVTKGRHRFNVARIPVRSAGIPKAFNGLRIVQISDMHLGSYGDDTSIVQKGVDMINAEKPDLILFTGDLVNDYADEAEKFVPILSKLEAPMGKFSILGNHDYSDYVKWDSATAKSENLEKLKKLQHDMGFTLLLDRNVTLQKDGDQVGLIGVQNWGKRFQQYGDLAKAMRGSEMHPFRILMSHDPTHWEEQVKGTGIDLTLSGHTHGAQFGVRINGRTYSPAQWVYRHWAGEYQENGQTLYVNRGFGFIGFPGRVGMPPEITVFDLQVV